MIEIKKCICFKCENNREVSEYFCRLHLNSVSYKRKKELIKDEKVWESERERIETPKTQKQIDFEFINSVEFDVMDDNQRIIQLRYILSKILNDEYAE